MCNELLLPVDLGEDEVVHLSPESIDILGESLSKAREREREEKECTLNNIYFYSWSIVMFIIQ